MNINEEFKTYLEYVTNKEDFNEDEIKLIWFAEEIIDFTGYDDNLSLKIGRQLYETAKAIINRTQQKYMKENYEMYTRFTFLGLVLGTIPLFYKEVKKEGFNKKYYIVMLISAIAGIALFSLNKDLFPVITDPNLFQSVLLGFAVAGSSIVPGVDSAVILSTLGLYELYVGSIADFNLSILIPAAFGLGIGVLVISFLMNKLLSKFYTVTFSIIFGLFLSIIPNVLNSSCVLGFNLSSVIAIILVIIGFIFSYFLGDIKNNIAKIKSFAKKVKRLKSNNDTDNV